MDFKSGLKTPINTPKGTSFIDFITDDLWLLTTSPGAFLHEKEYVFNQQTGDLYPIPRFDHLHPELYNSYKLRDFDLLIEELRKADRVFLLASYYNTIFAMPKDLSKISSQGFLVFSNGLKNPGMVKEFLQENHIAYQTISLNHSQYFAPREPVSPDGRFVAQPDGIYLSKTSQRIVDAYSVRVLSALGTSSTVYFSVLGWTSDSSGVIYSTPATSFSGHVCTAPSSLIQAIIIRPDDVEYCIFDQPILMLKVPEKYLSTQETP